MRRRPAGDQHRLRVVRDHAGHELDVGVAVGLPHEIRARDRLRPLPSLRRPAGCVKSVEGGEGKTEDRGCEESA